jgi:16S rRNA (guanine966-N2)-methyltransferase
VTRIIAGDAGSVRLEVPSGKGTRPTTDKVREAVFSRLESWGFLTGTRVLDLFAGSGALGFEAASRGAAEVTLVERHKPAIRTITANARAISRSLSHAVSLEIKSLSALTFLQSYEGTSFDVVFLDPPYDYANRELEKVLTALKPHLVSDATLVVERDSRSPDLIIPDSLQLIQQKKYGETTLWWLEPVQTTTADESF